MIIYWLYAILTIFLCWLMLKITKSKTLVIIYYVISLIILFSYNIILFIVEYYYKDRFENTIKCQYEKCLKNKDDICNYDIYCNDKQLPYCITDTDGKCKLNDTDCEGIECCEQIKNTTIKLSNINIDKFKETMIEYHINFNDKNNYLGLVIYLLPFFFVLFILKYLN